MAAPPTVALTPALSERACALSFEDLPDDVVELARDALTDWFAVALAGSCEEAPRILLAALGGGDVDGEATVIGHALGLPAKDAALVNGTASHVLDFDDVNLLLPGHVSAAVLATALALAERIDATGAELLTAFVAGYETACRVALAIGRGPYQRGFHATGTIGTFGAAAACARLLRLGAGDTAVALGIAASEAAGLKCNMGTMTKSLHAGRACEAGLLAADLAARGFTASAAAIEAEQGFAAVSGGDCDVQAALAEAPRGGWHLRGNLFKHHASCWFTHSAIEGIREHDAAAANVRRVVLHVSEVELGACVIPAPVSGLEVKFSIAHLAAMALLGRDTTTIGDAAASDQDAVALRELVVLEPDGEAGAPTRVEIELDGGKTLTAERDVNEPESDAASRRVRLHKKFETLVTPVLGGDPANVLLEALAAVEHTHVRELLAAASGVS